MRMPSQEKTLQRLQNPAETLCERPRAGTLAQRLRGILQSLQCLLL